MSIGTAEGAVKTRVTGNAPGTIPNDFLDKLMPVDTIHSHEMRDSLCPPRSPATLGALLLLALGFLLLASYSSLYKYPWQDEVLTLIATQDSFGKLFQTHLSHKAYIIAAKGCTALFGSGYPVLRIPSVLMGVANIFLIYLLGKRLFGREVGLISAFFLLLHPDYLFFASNARGPMGVVFFSLLAVDHLWRLLHGGNLLFAFSAAIGFYLSYRMHPTGALILPGIALGILVVTTYNLTTKRLPARNLKRLMTAFAVFGILGAAAFGPRLYEYIKWKSLTVPAHVAGGSEIPVGTPDIGTWEGFRFHVAPLVCARGHEGWIVSLGLALALSGILLSGRKHWPQSLFVFLPCISPFVFFFFYDAQFIARRYLFCSLPFFVLLTSFGIERVCHFCCRIVPKRFSSPSKWSLESALLLVFFVQAYGPLRAEIESGGYGDRWMVPLEKIANQPFMSDIQIVVAESVRFVQKHALPFWEMQLVTLGVDEERVAIEKVESASDIDLFAEKYLGNSPAKDSVWIVTRDHEKSAGVRERLLKAGWAQINFSNSLCFFPDTFFESKEGAKSRGENLLTFMDRDLRMDPFFHFTAAKLANRHGLEDLSKRFEAKAITAMQRQVRWDFPRTAGRMTSVIVGYYLSREELLEAGRWSCYAFGEAGSRYTDYVTFLDRVPMEDIKTLANNGTLKGKRFASGLIRTFEESKSIDDAYRGYWSHRAANVLEQAGDLPQALRLYEYSVQKGDTLGRSAKRLEEYYSSSRGKSKTRNPQALD